MHNESCADRTNTNDDPSLRGDSLATLIGMRSLASQLGRWDQAAEITRELRRRGFTA